jgi:hypothetical protein
MRANSESASRGRRLRRPHSASSRDTHMIKVALPSAITTIESSIRLSMVVVVFRRLCGLRFFRAVAGLHLVIPGHLTQAIRNKRILSQPDHPAEQRNLPPKITLTDRHNEIPRRFPTLQRFRNRGVRSVRGCESEQLLHLGRGSRRNPARGPHSQDLLASSPRKSCMKSWLEVALA